MNDYVRPGRFLATLHAMRSELSVPDGANGPGAAAAPGMLQRMEQVREEALAVLQQIQSKGGASAPSAPAVAS